jgi:hypothetical protein
VKQIRLGKKRRSRDHVSHETLGILTRRRIAHNSATVWAATVNFSLTGLFDLIGTRT